MTTPPRRLMPGLFAYWCIAAVILLIVMGKFLLFRAAYLYTDIASDSINVVYPQMRHLISYFRTDGIPGWSFNQGLGQNIYPFSWNDPFYLILLPFHGARLPFGFAYMEAAKLLAAGTFFYLYLVELALAENAAVAGALLYSFSSYLVIGSAWAIFSTEAVYCALLLYAFERFLKDGSGKLVPAAVALLALQQPFLLYPYALFFALYGAVRFIDENGWAPRKCASFLFRFAWLAALGAAISGILLFSELLQMLQSPRVASGASFFKTLAARPIFETLDSLHGVTALLRLYSSDLLGTGTGFHGWGNYLEAPMFYCGLVCLLLAPQAFPAMDRRRRWLYGAFSAFMSLPVVFPYMRHAFWLFSGDYYRTFSLFFAVSLLFFSMRALKNIEESSRTHRFTLAASLTMALILLYAVPAAWKVSVDGERRAVVAALLVGYAALIALLGSKKRRRSVGIALILLIGIEAAWSSWRTINARDFVTARDLAEKRGYDDSTVGAVAFLKSSEPSFYRVVKNYSSSPTIYMNTGLNDAKAQDYFGTSSYAQFNQASYIEFLEETGAIDDPTNELETRYVLGLFNRPKLMSLVGVKYLLIKAPTDVLVRYSPDIIRTFGDVAILKSLRPLPLGFTYDRCLTRREFRTLDSAGKDAELLDAFVVDDAGDCLGFSRFPSAAVARPDNEKRYDAAIRARTADVLSITTRSQNSIVGTISLRARKLLFFSIPYDAGWTAVVDGRPAQLARVDVGFMGLPLDPGAHRVELRFQPPLRRLGAAVSFAGLAIYGLLLF